MVRQSSLSEMLESSLPVWLSLTGRLVGGTLCIFDSAQAVVCTGVTLVAAMVPTVVIAGVGHVTAAVFTQHVQRNVQHVQRNVQHCQQAQCGEPSGYWQA
jgi:hypothetical protein